MSTEEERKLIALYGRLPTQKKGPLSNKLKEKRYFDSGDYALSKAGKVSQNTVGTAIPSPENIPHASPPTTTVSGTVGGSGTSPTNAATNTVFATSPTKDIGLAKESAPFVDHQVGGLAGVGGGSSYQSSGLSSGSYDDAPNFSSGSMGVSEGQAASMEI